jgi:hypothetical protein
MRLDSGGSILSLLIIKNAQNLPCGQYLDAATFKWYQVPRFTCRANIQPTCISFIVADHHWSMLRRKTVSLPLKS